MQINTKLGLVDIPNEVIIAAARDLGASVVPSPEPQGHSSAFAVADGWPAEAAYPSAEAYFIDRDMFVEYVRSVLNPAREKEELSTCTPAVAAHLFDVMTTRRYRQPVGKQANEKAQTRADERRN